MNKFKLSNISLKIQFVLSYLFVSILIISICGVLTYKAIITEFRNIKEEYTIGSFEQFEKNVESLIDDINRFSRVISSNNDVQKYMKSDYYDEYDQISTFNSISNYISAALSNYEYIDSVFFKNEHEILGFSSYRSWKQDRKPTELNKNMSSVLDKAHEKFPQILWSGGGNVLNFSTIDNINSENLININLISATKEYRSFNYAAINWFVVINIPEKYFSSIYKRIIRTKQESVQILDEDYKIISGGIPQELGRKSKYSDVISSNKKFGSVAYKDDKSDKQLIFYKITRMGWTVIHEIPFSQYSSNIVALKNTLILTFLISLILMGVIYTFWISKITAPFKTLMTAMKSFGSGKIGIQIPGTYGNELGALVNQFNDMSKEIHKYTNYNKIIQEEKHKMEMQILQSQISPHFIYNTLNMIRWMAAMVKAGNIVDVVVSLNKLLRPVFTSKNVIWTLKEEFEYIENYIYLVNKRFGDGITFDINVDKNLLENKVLRFVLQPIVENSAIHGFLYNVNNGKIRIWVKSENDSLLLIINDNGCGISPMKLSKISKILDNEIISSDEDNSIESVGLNNINRRLKLHFGDLAKLKIESEEGLWTSVTVIFPRI